MKVKTSMFGYNCVLDAYHHLVFFNIIVSGFWGQKSK